MTNLYGWDFPPQDLLQNYINKCKLFVKNDEAFANFRRDEDYIKVLEGKEYNVGKIYLNKIKREYGLNALLNNIDKFKENDIYGNPLLFDYDGVKQINHNTIMYIYHTLDMKRLMGDFQPKRIIEIGGGYGGMCKVFNSIYSFEEYILVDLPEVIALCKKYLGHFPELYKKIAFLTPEDIEINSSFGNFDLSIAVFSLSECNEEIQNIYTNKIVNNSKYSFIGYNRLHIPAEAAIYSRLMKKLSQGFSVSFDNSVMNCLYIYLTKKGGE